MDARFAIGLIGSLLLVTGVATTSARLKNGLFAIGNACMLAYALVGYLDGGPIFFLILQMFIALSTISMLLNIPDRYATPLLGLCGLVLIAWSLSLFEGYSTVVFVTGITLLGIGFAMDASTMKREVALMMGSAVIAVFSILMHDWIFTGLNILFAGLSLVNILRIARHPCVEEEGIFKKEFVDEIKRREKDHRLILAEKVFKEL